MKEFDALHLKRKNFVKENQNRDNKILKGNNAVLLSAPHGVPQVRLGKPKFQEIGSLATALYLYENTDCSLIAKTKNNYDDANFDENCKYRKNLIDFVTKNKIRYVVDFHGLAEHRTCDVNLGINLGFNVSNNIPLFEELNKKLVENEFVVSVDNPFMAVNRTISGMIKNKFPDAWSIQIEINSAITNKRENWEKYKKLLKVLTDWLNMIE